MNEDIIKETIDSATDAMLARARTAGIDTVFDRAERMKPCPIGVEGSCCRMCGMGPCRVPLAKSKEETPEEKGKRRGLCGATAETIVARNFARMVAAGTAAHSDHARKIVEAFILTAEGKIQDFALKDEQKLFALALDYGIEIGERPVAEIAQDVGHKALAEFGRQEGEISLLRRAPLKRQELWRKLEVCPRGIDREVVETLHRTHMGVDQDYESLLRQATRVSLADGWGGSMLATELQDVMFGTPAPVLSEINLGVLKTDQVNVVIHGHEPQLAEMLAVAAQDPRLIAYAAEKGASGINLAGMCCTANEILMRHGVPIAGNFLQQELAIITGAVEAMVVDVQCIMQGLVDVAACFHTKVITTDPRAHIKGAIHVQFEDHHALETARGILMAAIDNYPNRPAGVSIPQEKTDLIAGFSHETISYLQGGLFRASYRPLNENIINGRIRGVAGVVGCNNARVPHDSAHVRLVRELIKNNILVLQTGCAAMASAKAGLMVPEAAALAGAGLRSVCEALGIPPVLHLGSCVDNARILIAATAMVKDGGLGDDISDLPAAGAAPEWMSEKALAIGQYFVSSGVFTIFGASWPTSGSREVTEHLFKDYEKIYGGKWAFENDPLKMAEMIIAHIETKRQALGLDQGHERVLYDMNMRRELEAGCEAARHAHEAQEKGGKCCLESCILPPATCGRRGSPISKIIASAAIRGAYKIIERAENDWCAAMERHGARATVGFPNTAYYLPVIYAMTGLKVEKLGDMETVLKRCRTILPPPVREINHLPYLAPALDAGMAAFFAEEIIEALRYLEQPEFYTRTEDPAGGNIWLGAADDVILRKRGVEFVDGTAPGFAAILGAAPSDEIATKIAAELQHKNLYVFMSAASEEQRFAEQLGSAGVQIGWSTRLVPFGPEVTATVFALGFAVRAAMSFGGIEPGDYRRNLIYNKDRIFAFAMPLGSVSDEWYANAAGAINFGFPVIASAPIPEVLPTGICTYEHVVSNIPHDKIVSRALEVRGLKVAVTEIPIPVSYSPAYEGERVRGDDIYLEAGGGRTIMVEWVTSKPMEEVDEGRIDVIGPEIVDLSAGTKLPLAIVAEVAGRQMQEDYEPIMERQIHHLLNYAQGVMHIGQRDIAWLRISKQATEKGFELRHLGVILHAKLHQDFGRIFDKLQVKIYSAEDKVKEVAAQAKMAYTQRDTRIDGLTDESSDTYYSCTMCQSFAPNHVCIISPERTGLCGSYNWMDCKAAHEINPTGPNQPVTKGRAVDLHLGQWQGVNDFLLKASRGKLTHYNLYSIINDPTTACGCMECIAAVLPLCNGFMTVNREFAGMTPSGMKFTTLAGTIGGGVSTPGFVGHGKYNIMQRKFLVAEGGIKRLVWMPKMLKEEIRERFTARAAEIGLPDLLERIADDTIGTTEEEIMSFLTGKQHPALTMDPIM